LLGLSGGDAVEAALKTAMLATNRYQFLSFDGCYHGLQFAPLALNNRDIFTSGFEKWIDGKCVTLPFPYFPANILCESERPTKKFFEDQHRLLCSEQILLLLEDQLKTKKFAALVLEPIQGRGGKRTFSKEFMQQCSFLCKKYGTLLIFDEIYTGFGRTGKMFAFEHFGIIPDLLCVGKALGGGLPISACVGEIMDVWGKSTGEARHTQTFLGHPLACAVAYKHILEIQKSLPEFQSELSLHEKEWLSFVHFIKSNSLHERFPFEIRGMGFMRGLWFYSQKEGFCVEMMEYLLEKGFIILPEGPRADVLSVTPPLITKAKDLRILLKEVAKYLINYTA
jgi:4-aminobutyrate aminotransferase-like enzyme